MTKVSTAEAKEHWKGPHLPCKQRLQRHSIYVGCTQRNVLISSQREKKMYKILHAEAQKPEGLSVSPQTISSYIYHCHPLLGLKSHSIYPSQGNKKDPCLVYKAKGMVGSPFPLKDRKAPNAEYLQVLFITITTRTVKKPPYARKRKRKD